MAGSVACGVAELVSGVVVGALGVAADGMLLSAGAAAGADGVAGAFIWDESVVTADVLVVDPVLAPPLAVAISIDFRSPREAWR